MIGRWGKFPSLEDKRLGTAKLICREAARQGTEVMVVIPPPELRGCQRPRDMCPAATFPRCQDPNQSFRSELMLAGRCPTSRTQEMSTPPTNRFVTFGFLGAVLATILGAAVLPDHPRTGISVFARATAYILAVFATAATATYLGFLVRGEGRTIRAKQIVVRTATTTLWLP